MSLFFLYEYSDDNVNSPYIPKIFLRDTFNIHDQPVKLEIDYGNGECLSDLTGWCNFKFFFNFVLVSYTCTISLKFAIF